MARCNMAAASAAAPMAMAISKIGLDLPVDSRGCMPATVANSRAPTTRMPAARSTAVSPRGLPVSTSALARDIKADHNRQARRGRTQEHSQPRREVPLPTVNESLMIMWGFAQHGHSRWGTGAPQVRAPARGVPLAAKAPHDAGDCGTDATRDADTTLRPAAAERVAGGGKGKRQRETGKG